MGKNASSLAAKEKERGGLVVLSAQYGPATAFSPKGVSDDEAVIDVTIPLQALVQNSKLYIPGGRNKFNLMGFWVSRSRRADMRPRMRGAVRRGASGARGVSQSHRRTEASQDGSADTRNRTLASAKRRSCACDTCSATSCTRSRSTTSHSCARPSSRTPWTSRQRVVIRSRSTSHNPNN